VSVWKVRSFLKHEGFYWRFINDFLEIALPLCKILAKDADFMFGQKVVLFHSYLKLSSGFKECILLKP